MTTAYRQIDGQWRPVSSHRKPHFRIKNGALTLVRPAKAGTEISEQEASRLIKRHHQYVSAFADSLRLPRQSVYAALSSYHTNDSGFVRQARLSLGLQSTPTDQAMSQAWFKASRRTTRSIKA